MTTQEIMALGPALSAYLRRFADCFDQDRTRQHLETYCRGLLSALARKSVEPRDYALGISEGIVELRIISSNSAGFQPAISRVPLMPCLGLEFLMRAWASLRRVVKLWAPLPARSWWASSPKTTSKTQCNPFSIFQWSRTAFMNISTDNTRLEMK